MRLGYLHLASFERQWKILVFFLCRSHWFYGHFFVASLLANSLQCLAACRVLLSEKRTQKNVENDTLLHFCVSPAVFTGPRYSRVLYNVQVHPLEYGMHARTNEAHLELHFFPLPMYKIHDTGSRLECPNAAQSLENALHNCALK